VLAVERIDVLEADLTNFHKAVGSQCSTNWYNSL